MAPSKFILSFILSITLIGAIAQEEGEYTTPSGVVNGGEFIDLIKPLQSVGELRSDVWGAESVKPRDILNGLEDPEYSYWGGDIMEEDGRYHMFTCRWREDNVVGLRSGHMTWGSSEVVYAVADNPCGPYVVQKVLGKGHNPEIYRAVNGDYMVGGMVNTTYISKNIDGPWRRVEPKIQFIRRPSSPSNRTYATREDGSVIMMSQKGLYFSEDGTEDFFEVVDSTIYAPHPVNGGEDPVIWRDEVQYHCIFNGPRYRSKAFYMRSKDGIRWSQDDGIAYDADVVRHADGSLEGWYKLERPKVIQDKFGRATHLHVSAIDTLKWEDLANDKYSSKNIIIPLTVSRRMEILNRGRVTAATSQIKVKILAEETLAPIKNIDINSLRFGAPKSVDFGGGARAIESKVVDGDLIVTFEGDNGFTDDDYVGKLLGEDVTGGLIYGYAKMLLSANDLVDKILLQTIPNRIPQSGELRFAVNYQTSEERSLVLDLVDKESGKVLTSKLLKNVKGEDISVVTLEITEELMLEHEYSIELYLTENNNITNRISDKVSKSVKVLDPNAPEEMLTLARGIVYLPESAKAIVPIEYVVNERTDIQIEVYKSAPWTLMRTYPIATIEKGDGVVDVEFSYDPADDFVAGGKSSFVIYLSEHGGGVEGRKSGITHFNAVIVDNKKYQELGDKVYSGSK